MSGASNKFYQGSFTSTGAPISINLGFIPKSITVNNLTSAVNLLTTATVPLTSKWMLGMAQGSATQYASSGTALAGSPQPVEASYISGNGISLNSTAQITYAAGSYTGSLFTNANPAVISGITTQGGAAALVTGQTGILWLSKAFSASQWANAFYNFVATSPTSIELVGVDNSAFTAGATTVFTIVQNIGLQMLKNAQVITALSASSATELLVTLSTNVSGLQVGDYIMFQIPYTYGSVYNILNVTNSRLINNLGGYKILAVSGNQLTVEADITGGSFSYPTDLVVQAAVGETYQKPFVVPCGVNPSIYNQPQGWQGSIYLTLGASVVGNSGDLLFVEASDINIS